MAVFRVEKNERLLLLRMFPSATGSQRKSPLRRFILSARNSTMFTSAQMGRSLKSVWRIP